MTEFMERELMKYMKSSMKAMTPMKSKNMQDKKSSQLLQGKHKTKILGKKLQQCFKDNTCEEKKDKKWG